MTLSLPLVLASASPRRQQMLSQLVDSFEVMAADIKEVSQPGEPPSYYVMRLAREKAQAIAAQKPGCWVLGSDTIVVQGDRIFEKPKDRAEGIAMLQALSGSCHEVMTAIALVRGDELKQIRVDTKVWFRKLTAQELSEYWDTGEPCDKAGGYGIQGLAGSFVERIEGSYSAVVGLPLCQTHELLHAALLEK